MHFIMHDTYSGSSGTDLQSFTLLGFRYLRSDNFIVSLIAQNNMKPY